MSTRSFIIVKVRKEDIGKEIKFDAKKLPCRLEEWGDEGGKEKSEPVVINNKYIGVYCHWDGYPSGVGAALKKTFPTYEDALNLIAGGSISGIDADRARHYANREGEAWEYIKPKKADIPKKLYKDSWAEYAYLLEDGDEWKCDNMNGKGFKNFKTE